NARFVHIIRDGRDICASMSSRWKKNGVFRGFPFLLYEAPDKVFDAWTEDPTVTTALWWEWNVSLGQRFGRKLGSEMYYEMRYERLVEHPEAECRDLCHFLGLRFEDSMLRHHENFKPRRGPNGNILHASVGLPVTRGLRDWRSELRTDDISLFEAAAASFLDQLGYECVTQPDAKCLDQARRVRSTFQDRATLALNRDRAVAVVA
ncbi:MAG: sulfotransferase, partial [Acidobacteriaceae bacterium]|nr:sulfotransferase [Acidobacteriaceae bacterium]